MYPTNSAPRPPHRDVQPRGGVPADAPPVAGWWGCRARRYRCRPHESAVVGSPAAAAAGLMTRAATTSHQPTPSIPFSRVARRQVRKDFVMSSAEPPRLTDQLWLAAHDVYSGKPVIAERLLGVGLATGLLVELVHHGFLELYEGELFRTKTSLPADLALRPLLTKMAEEEQHRPPPPADPRRAAEGQGWPAPARNDHGWMEPERHSRHSAAQDAWGIPPVQEVDRHRVRGHDLREWIAFLAREHRAEDRVVDRLSRAGLVVQKQRRRLLGRSTVQSVPYDTVVAGSPATSITSALKRRLLLHDAELLLAGLFLATNLHRHALATLGPDDLDELTDQLKRRLDATSRELLKAADTAVADTALL